MAEDLRVLSLGAGVQSTTLALMAAHGEIEPPDCAIFADTQWEPAAVYQHLDWLETQLPFPVRRVTAGNLRQAIRDHRNTIGGRFAAVPWHMVMPDGSEALGRRQCSREYKIDPIAREVRRLLGKARPPPGSCEMLIGISKDEAHRMREARQAYLSNRYPLIEQNMRRYDCLLWLKRHGYSEPAKSACIGCPFNSNDRLRSLTSEEWADAVLADQEIRHQQGIHATQYMHRSRVPLSEVDLSVDDRQLDLFVNECEGLCGV